ncbi:prepilin-type N-terminal cleavage/methylation domain-containing protein [Rhodanobacter glycinis]|uniref:Prepilin-type N-terminal cleavage/methylation domain-containing protein n=1 Tax=Rhodanobacter glycinis TaxID=582702 RepID=A0A5B9DY32_9GAMM|nr:PilW family protein [Rhodanobacter glycinis]QEE24449.1 prepilin-type N-terminal cleavage/methylation domain-containing protein [Rhodanobacter glycinis]
MPQGQAQSGFTLIELMVAMLLGLIVIAGVTSIFLANQRVYRTNTALGDVQDSARVAFEMMARDIRDAGLTGCNSTPATLRLSNLLKNGPTAGGTAWWADWNNSVHGYDGSGATSDPALSGMTITPVASTDSIQLIGAVDSGVTVATDTETSGVITTNESSPGLVTGDVGLVCDPDHSTLVQFTSVSGNSLTHAINTGSPGNCSQGLGYPAVCTDTGNSYTFQPNAQIAKLSAVDWYIGSQTIAGATVDSLYRVDLENKAGVPTPTTQEMVRNVTNMQIQYHVSGANSFVDAGSVPSASWGSVDAVQVTFTLQSTDQRAGTNTKPLVRTFTATTSIRNRVTVL